MKKIIAMMMALTMVLALAACGQKAPAASSAPAPAPSAAPAEKKETTYAVEAGSAGEAVALEKGFKVVSVDT